MPFTHLAMGFNVKHDLFDKLNTSIVVNKVSTYNIFRDSEDENKHDVNHQLLKQLKDTNVK